MTVFLALVACASNPACDASQTRLDGTCAAYQAGDPVAYTGAPTTPGTSYQIQYSGTLDTTLDVRAWDVDLFDTTDADLGAIQSQGEQTLCYFSAGSYEDWRPDASEFPKDSLGNALDGWPGEWWVDITNSTVRGIMQARLDLAVTRGCTGVDPDNVNGFENPTGLQLNATMQLDYNRFLADEAHKRGLSVGLKNDTTQLADLEPWFDWGVNEQCVTYDECDGYSVFTDAQKAILHVEYVDDWANAQSKAESVCGVGPNLDTVVKMLDLGAERLACPS